MTTLEVLKEARTLISKGWTRGHYAHKNSYCMVGAVMHVCAGRDERQLACRASKEALMGCLPKGYLDLVMFNDTPDRTKEEVLAVFDKAIAEAAK